MKRDFSFNMNRESLNVNWMKVWVTQRKNGIMMDAGVGVKN